MVQLSGRIISILTPALIALVLLTSCSEDSPVDSDQGDPFKGKACFDYTDYMHTVSLIDTPGWAMAVAIDGDFVYVADAGNGLQIMEFSDPAAPVLRGAVAGSDPAVDVAASDGIACLTMGTGGLAVVDVGDPDSPAIVGQLTTPGTAQGVAILDTIAYVADDVIGLMLISIARPQAPYSLGVDNSPGEAVDVAVSGAFAYVADRDVGCRVVNVNDPLNPWLVNTVGLSFGGRGVDVAGDLAFVAAGAAGLQIIDVSTPGAEAVIDSLDTGGVASRVAVDPRREVVFVAKGRNGKELVNVAGQGSPELITMWATSGEALGVATAGGFAVFGESAGGVRAVNTTEPRIPPVTAKLSSVQGDVNLVAGGSGRAYGTGPAVGLFVVEPSDFIIPPLGTVGLSYDADDLVVVGDTVIVATRTRGMEIIDVTDPTNPKPVGWLPYLGAVVTLDWSSGVLHFAGGQRYGTWTKGADRVGTARLGGSEATAVAGGGDYAYVGKSNNSMQGVNIEIPDQPVAVFTLPTAGSSRDMLEREGYLFIMTAGSSLPNSSDGVQVYDVRNPLGAAPVAFVNLSTSPRRAALADDILYVSVGSGGVVVFDVGDPLNPLRIGSVPSQGESKGTAVTGGSVFIADGNNGMFTVPEQGCVPSP